jgi:uncharacterized membrane protein
MARFRNIFFSGLFVLLPIFATIQLVTWLINTVDSSTRSFFLTRFLPFDFSGMGLILTFVLIYGVGWSAQYYLGKAFFSTMDGVLRRAPVVGGVYGSLQKFFDAILNPHNDQFSGVVLIEFPRKGIYSIGFRTGNPDPRIAKSIESVPAGFVNVFIPLTPNPTSGFYLLVQEKELIPLDMSVQEAFKNVISMGLVT